jgi:hypothetical protein
VSDKWDEQRPDLDAFQVSDKWTSKDDLEALLSLVWILEKKWKADDRLDAALRELDGENPLQPS